MLIRNPINPYPQNITVSPSKANLSFTFMGDRLGSYQVKIYSYSVSEAEALIYTGNVINIENYIFNNSIIEIDTPLAEMGIQPDRSYTWEVVMSPYLNLGNNNENGSQFNFTSLRYFFQTAYTPQIASTPDGEDSSFLVNGVKYLYGSEAYTPHIEVNDLQNRKLNIEGYYFNGNIKYYYFQLFDEDNNLIEETNKKFSTKIEYNFSGLLSPKQYTLYCYAVSQNEQYITVIFDISTNYQVKQDMNYPPILSCNENEANVKIKWIKDSTSIPKIEGTYVLDQTKGELDIQTGTIVYDNISSLPITMDENNFAVGIKTTINDDTNKIFDYINNEILYEIYMENYVLYLRYGKINSSNKIIKDCYNFKSNIVFGIQNSSIPASDTGYMWYEEGYNVPNNETEYLLVSSKEEHKYSILLQNNNGTVSCDIKKIS